MLPFGSILLTLSGVFAQNENWAVFYPPSEICAVRGFDAVLPCNYSFPQSQTVNQTLWCSMKTNNGTCINPPYVYDSNSSIHSDYVYTGDNKSICTLLIHNVQYDHSTEYRFIFITSKDKWTGVPGVTLEVADLKVSLIRISGNGTIKEGDSLNLTCDLNCTHAPSQLVWSKNNQNINRSGPVLHFPDLTVEDSGNYTCAWRRNENWGSDSIFLHVEAGQNPDRLPFLFNVTVAVVVLVVGGILIGLVVAAVIHSRRRVQAEASRMDDSVIYANVP